MRDMSRIEEAVNDLASKIQDMAVAAAREQSNDHAYFASPISEQTEPLRQAIMKFAEVISTPSTQEGAE